MYNGILSIGYIWFIFLPEKKLGKEVHEYFIIDGRVKATAFYIRKLENVDLIFQFID